MGIFGVGDSRRKDHGSRPMDRGFVVRKERRKDVVRKVMGTFFPLRFYFDMHDYYGKPCVLYRYVDREIFIFFFLYERTVINVMT